MLNWPHKHQQRIKSIFFYLLCLQLAMLNFIRFEKIGSWSTPETTTKTLLKSFFGGSERIILGLMDLFPALFSAIFTPEFSAIHLKWINFNDLFQGFFFPSLLILWSAKFSSVKRTRERIKKFAYCTRYQTFKINFPETLSPQLLLYFVGLNRKFKALVERGPSAQHDVFK